MVSVSFWYFTSSACRTTEYFEYRIDDDLRMQTRWGELENELRPIYFRFFGCLSSSRVSEFSVEETKICKIQWRNDVSLFICIRIVYIIWSCRLCTSTILSHQNSIVRICDSFWWQLFDVSLDSLVLLSFLLLLRLPYRLPMSLEVLRYYFPFRRFGNW